MNNILRHPAEVTYQTELEALKAEDNGRKPENWLLSPQLVVKYLMGGKTKDGLEISPKYIGKRRLIEAARLSTSLAAVRQRPAPGFEEIRESIVACLCFGSSLSSGSYWGMSWGGFRPMPPWFRYWKTFSACRRS